MELLDYRNFVSINEAKKSKKSDEALAGLKAKVPTSVANSIEKENKIEQFTKFIDNLPPEAIPIVEEIFEKLDKNKNWAKEFAEKLWSLDWSDPTGTKVIDTKEYADGTIGGYIFNLAPAGMGKGEVFMAWLIEDSAVQGKSESFDMMIGGTNGQKFEVKDYREYGKNQPVRLGQGIAFTMSDSKPFEQIRKTLNLIQSLQMDTRAGTVKRDLKDSFEGQDENFRKDLADVILQLEGRRKQLLQSSLMIGDRKNLQKFYDMISKVDFVEQGYIAIEIRGTKGFPLIERSIKPLTLEQIESGKFTVEVTDGKQAGSNDSYVLAQMQRIDYIAKPEDFQKDLDEAVRERLKDESLVVFRPYGITFPSTDQVFFHSADSGGRPKIAIGKDNVDVDDKED